jgi:hypothetical protein
MRDPDRHAFRCGIFLMLIVSVVADARGQQIAIPRIEQMPRKPSPYLMRDWKQVALGYDSLAFNLSKTGQYLPLVFLNTSTVNYPGEMSFGLSSYVGDGRSTGEAINVLPAVVGATLCGVDKKAQFGRNWARMCQEYFNNRPEEDVYLNGAEATSGDDWWYDVMPNVFFYQLYSRYPTEGDFQRQFRMVADRWNAAVFAMGGRLTPWSHPNLNHRGWRLASMTPNNETPHEPEAGGAIAWLLYAAAKETDEPAYRYAAELCLEELTAYGWSPAYELQLSYGTLAAARMNAELGTQLNVEKMVNWCFDVSPLRSWGAMVGRWGAYDCSGLIGEVNGTSDYAFAMNTFEQIGALVPLVRYDPRFSRAIGKWVLNAANASRLFYANYLPEANQDSRSWSALYDPSSWLAHEALRQSGPGSVSPYATGDAMGGGWAPTNLSLYSSSHVGILGAIIDTTEVPGVLKLDLLATDYFHAPAYPSYLFYNPDSVARQVTLDVGGEARDLYDAVGRSFIARGVAGPTAIQVPPDGAVLAVLAPAGGVVTYDQEQLLVDGVVVDYHSGVLPANFRPHVKGFAAATSTVYIDGMTRLYCTATDRDGDTLAYAWSANGGTLSGTGPSVFWAAPATTGSFSIGCRVADSRGAVDSALLAIAVVDSPLSQPVIQDLRARPGMVDPGGATTIACTASDPAGYPLSYSWTAARGSLQPLDSTAVWTAPDNTGDMVVVCEVTNTVGGRVVDSITIPVRDFSNPSTGPPILDLRFDGDTRDASGFGNHGTQTDVLFVADRFGGAASAAGFNGATSNVRIPNSSSLSVDSAITVSLWVKSGLLFNREMFLVSHGSWQNRWKISIAPERRIRWTVKTASGVKDVDSRTLMTTSGYLCVTGVYSGSDLLIYVDGELERFTSLSGPILTPNIDLLVGQMLPGDANYNFQGVVDDLLIYPYALTYPQVVELYNRTVPVAEDLPAVPLRHRLLGNYPNPFNGETVCRFEISERTGVKLGVYDLLGRHVVTLVDEEKDPGVYSVRFDGRNLASGVYVYRLEVRPLDSAIGRDSRNGAGTSSETQRMLLMK